MKVGNEVYQKNWTNFQEKYYDIIIYMVYIILVIEKIVGFSRKKNGIIMFVCNIITILNEIHFIVYSFKMKLKFCFLNVLCCIA